MSIFDISLIIILAAFVFNGLFKGVIRSVGHIIGLFVGAYVASHYYLVLFEWGKNLAAGHDNAGKVIAFVILFVLVARLVDFLFVLLEKLFKLVAIIPGSKYINNLLGAALGFLEGALFLGLIIFVISKYAIIGHFFGDQIVNSRIAPLLLKVANLAMPLLPEALKAIKSLF